MPPLDLQGARKPAPEDLGALALSDQINTIVGDAQDVIARAGNDRVLVLKVEAGSFRVRVGDLNTGFDLSPPGSTLEDGAQAVEIFVADGFVFLSAPDFLSVQGQSPTDRLAYYFL